ncbi:MAG: hypothetical protein LLG01_07550 [Planctomycetaceae bacterium]|nr:hypothetical protein [Planctomycetaceae bacterium]
MEENNPRTDFEVVSQIITSLSRFGKEEQLHIIKTVATWLRLGNVVDGPSEEAREPASVGMAPPSNPQFSNHSPMTPKMFLMEKMPQTDAERICCLAYYLTYYREMPHFRTEDLSKLNTEAAQRKFSNAGFTAKNAVRDGFLVGAGGKNRQLSAVGEQYVELLPDRSAARLLLNRARPRRAKNRVSNSAASSVGQTE